MKELSIYTYENYIHAPIDVVFSYVDEDEKIKLWNTYFVENKYEKTEDKQANRPGVNFISISKFGKKTIEVPVILTGYNPPYRVSLQSDQKEGLSKTTYQLYKEEKGTILKVYVSILPKNYFYFLLCKLTGWTSKYVYDEQFKKLKSYIELEVDY